MWEQLQSIGNWKPQTRLVCLPYISSLFVTDRDKFQEHFFSVVCLPHCQIWVSIEGESLSHLMLISVFLHI